MRTHRFLPRADRDFSEVLAYLAEKSPHMVHPFIDALFGAIRLLEEYPEIAPAMEAPSAYQDGMRVWPVRNFEKWCIFYTISPDEIIVVRVLHASRDMEALLNED